MEESLSRITSLMTLSFEIPICLFAEHSSTILIFWEFGEGGLEIHDKSQEPCPSQYIWTQLPWSISRPKILLKRTFFMRNKSVGCFFLGKGGKEDLLK